MNSKIRDLLGSIFMLIFVVSLWVQRDFSTPFGAIFPDIVMGCVVVLVAVTVLVMFTPWGGIKNGEEKAEPAGAHWFDMIVVGAILLVWAILLRYLGFIATGFIGFTSISWFLNERRKSLRGLIMSAVTGAGMVGLLVMVFEYLLKVPLPKGTAFY